MGFGFRVQGLRFRGQGPRFSVEGVRGRVSEPLAGRAVASRACFHRALAYLVFGFGFWFLVFGSWFLVFGFGFLF